MALPTIAIEDSCRSFSLLKASAKSNSNLIANAFKSEKEIILEKESYIQKEANRTQNWYQKNANIKDEIKKIKSDNFTRSNRENSNIAIAILEKLPF